MTFSKKIFLEYRADFSYEKAHRYQSLLSREGFFGLLLFTPPPVITLGIASDGTKEITAAREFLQERKIEILATDRGGKATYHGPGQIVGFPIVNLKTCYGDARAVRRFTEDLLLGLAHAAAGLGLRSVETREGYPGVWTGKGKLASVGIAVKEGFVFHGFSVNINNEALSGFSLIKPCGMDRCPVTSFESEGVRVDDFSSFAKSLAPYLGFLFPEAEEGGISGLSYEQKLDDLISRVSKSSMALDHLSNQYADRV
jgi:lipoate-protein ligase B